MWNYQNVRQDCWGVETANSGAFLTTVWTFLPSVSARKYLAGLFKTEGNFVACSDADGMVTALNINLLKPSGYVMHQQFNIQQLYVLPTLYLCVLYLSENKQRLVPLIS